jgi:hypothetical protein
MRTPTVVNPREDAVSLRWRNYRLVRLAWWISFLTLTAFKPEIGLLIFVAVTLLAVFWKCPRCSKRVGIFSALYVIHVPWPFGGICMSCFKPLLKRPTDA